MFLLPFSIFFVIREQNPPFLLPNRDSRPSGRTAELGVSVRRKRHQALAEAEQGGQSNSKAGAVGFGAEPQ